jgi:hypothetical protein
MGKPNAAGLPQRIVSSAQKDFEDSFLYKRRNIMKQVRRFAMTLALALSIAASGFAAVNLNPKLKPIYRVETRTTNRKLSKSSRYGAKKIRAIRRTFMLRLLRQQRAFYHRLIGIKIN